MKYYPVFLNLNHQDCLVIGAGPVGVRKAEKLLQSGARVTVISLKTGAAFGAIEDRVTHRQKSYESNDLDGIFMVFAATDNADLNAAIRADAQKKNILCNVADAPDLSDFIVPSVISRGDLSIAVSTSGSSPAIARTLKKDLEKMFGPEYADVLALFKSIRKKLLAEGDDPEAHKKKFYRLVNTDVLEWIREGNIDRINMVLADIFGKGFRYQNLELNKE